MHVHPDAASARLCGWSPGEGLVLCDCRTAAGEPIELDPRHVLRSVAGRAAAETRLSFALDFRLDPEEDPRWRPGGTAPFFSTVVGGLSGSGLRVLALQPLGGELVRLNVRGGRRVDRCGRGGDRQVGGEGDRRAARPADHVHAPSTLGAPRLCARGRRHGTAGVDTDALAGGSPTCGRCSVERERLQARRAAGAPRRSPPSATGSSAPPRPPRPTRTSPAPPCWRRCTRMRRRPGPAERLRRLDRAADRFEARPGSATGSVRSSSSHVAIRPLGGRAGCAGGVVVVDYDRYARYVMSGDFID